LAKEKKILVLDDNSGQLGELIQKLTEARFKVRVCFSPDQALNEITVEEPHLVIAAGQFPNTTAVQFAEKAFEIRNTPAFIVLDSAGDTTQLRMRRHPAIIGTYYKPLKVAKLFDRIVKFFKT
jgi:DNA-binding NtrC family response regulator